MKIKKLRPVALVALGVFLGRAAQADTTIVFNQPLPPDEVNNPNGPPGITQAFGDYAAATSPGLTVSGFGTPNIGLGWSATGPDTRWEYYNDELSFNVWSAAQLNGSSVGSTHKITFTPNSASVSAVIKSFNLHGYYNSSERFTYKVSVLAGTNVVSGPTQVTFLSDATKNHPVSINYTGAVGQALKLRIDRVASTLGTGEDEGGAYNIAVDDIAFAQTPETVFPPGPQVVSVTPADEQTGVAANSHPYLASITNGATTVVVGSIQLQLDGSLVTPPPTISSAGGLTNVSHSGTSFLSSGDHIYKLTYNDNLGAAYTNEVLFSSIYTTLPTTYALPQASGIVRGFTYRAVSASTEATALDSTIARAKAQLNGTLINPDTTLPYTNSATLGTNADGYFDIDTVLNFDDNLNAVSGNFPDNSPFPGLELGFNNWFSTEALLYLDLPAGYYRFGVNSDDGFEVSATPPQGVSGSPLVVGVFDDARGPEDTLFDVQVQANGIYPFRVVYFESGGGASCEFFSVTNLATGDKVLVNDPADANAVKSFRVLAPRITSIVKNGPNAVLNWAYGTPPYQVQFKTNVTDTVWNNVGSPTPNRTANVPIQSATGFIRVRYTQP